MTNVANQIPALVQKLQTELAGIIDAGPSSIRAYVAQEVLDYDENPAQMFADLSQGGCQSGTIPSLIYYADTHQFFDHYYDEIEAMREEFEDSTGESLQVKGDLKN